ncbi:hypothetical protein MMC21_003113 [Puttea exsequens]|nr:hypothetical protein [Puttea exsequens]
MAEILKRPPSTDLNGDNAKKIRSNDGSPIPHTNGAAKPDVNKIMADARARAAAVAAKLQGSGVGTARVASPAQAPAARPGGLSRTEELKARVAAAMGTKGPSSNQRTSSPAQAFSPTPLDDGFSQARGGLGTALHPALMDNAASGGISSKNKQPIQSRFATTLANQRPISPANQPSKAAKGKKQLDLSGPSAEETRANPYFDLSLGPQTATQKSRNRKELAFNAKGKYIQQAALQRRQKALEEMKLRIQASAKKALDKGDPSEKNFVIEAPPAIEWWDENLIKTKNYDSLNDMSKAIDWDSQDAPITIYVQHPVLLDPPSSRLQPGPKPMYLTKQEQAKLRRQRRMADLKEHQSKIRLGLEPPEPPKVKLKNMMRVLGEQAVRDPTAVELQVNREIADRKTKHEQMNEDRKLTKEEVHEKLEQKKAQDVAKGVYVTVFKIDSLVNGKHRFKIGRNAEQMGLFGICLITRHMNLIITTGGSHGIANYKKLMLNRIQWNENDWPAAVREGNKHALQEEWLSSTDETNQLRDLSDNKCQLVWEGQLKELPFRKWTTKVCESEKDAMDILARSKLESLWTQAKSMP